MDEASGEVGIGITRKAGDGGVDGYGSVARVQFISSAGTPDGTRVDFAVSGVNANDSDGAPISIVPMSKSVTITTTVTAPTFDPLPGTYQSPVDVTLQCATPGATIYYTMDGTAPTQSDIIYSSPIHISETTTLSVRAYKQSMNPSTVAVGTYTIPGTNVESEKSSIPEEYELYQAYPNPFNPSTTISYAIPYSGRAINVELEIYNTLGERVRTLVDGFHEPGVYSVKWDGRDNRGLLVSGGMYLYRLKAGSRSLMKKMLLLR